MDNNALYLRGKLESNEARLNGSLQQGIPTGGTNDYNSLRNKPSINGTTLIGNYDEIDPTVPDYVKGGKALNSDDEVSFSELKEIWDSVFNN